MKDAVLLDTHLLVWLETGQFIRPAALSLIEKASLTSRLFASHITIWELGAAQRKKQVDKRPDLRGLTPGTWLAQVASRFSIQMLPISADVAGDAGNIPDVYGSGDPGDCFLIATARLHQLSLATRDTKIIKLSVERPDFIRIISC